MCWLCNCFFERSEEIQSDERRGWIVRRKQSADDDGGDDDVKCVLDLMMSLKMIS